METTVQTDFFEITENNEVKCTLCPHFCSLSNGQTGICGVRKNIDGKIYSTNYGIVSALHSDPIEKKPLYHFYPGKKILSMGTIGCNLFCNFCQNYEIAHPKNDLFFNQHLSPEKIVEKAVKQDDNIGIAYTYNEPVVFYEYMLETAKLAKSHELKNVMVSNGYINKLPLEKLLPFIDAFNIDLKGFTDEFYKKYTKSHLQPVLESLQQIYEAAKWLEITFLLIPEANDNTYDFEKMTDWIAQHLSDTTPLHISRYFPNYKLNTHKTPPEKLLEFYEIASKKLKYVYIGNYESKASNTYCPACGYELITRKGYQTKINLKNASNICPACENFVTLIN